MLIGTTRLNAANPLFLEIGIRPSQLAPFGVTVVGRSSLQEVAANDEVLLGWRAAENLGKHVGDPIQLDSTSYRVVGIYSTGQALGDAGAMLPLVWFQTYQRQPGQLTLLFVRAPRRGPTSQSCKDASIGTTLDSRPSALPSDFGRADRSLSLIKAAGSGQHHPGGGDRSHRRDERDDDDLRRAHARVRRPPLPSAGRRLRVMTMIVAEALVIGLLGAAAGSLLAVIAVRAASSTCPAWRTFNLRLHRFGFRPRPFDAVRHERARRALSGGEGRAHRADGEVAR